MERGKRKEKIKVVNVDVPKSRQTVEYESDEKKLKGRIKQILFGKNTLGYLNYQNSNQKSKIIEPNPFVSQSKRNFEGKIKKWRIELHKFDQNKIQIDQLNLKNFSKMDSLLEKYLEENELEINQKTKIPTNQEIENWMKKERFTEIDLQSILQDPIFLPLKEEKKVEIEKTSNKKQKTILIPQSSTPIIPLSQQTAFSRQNNYKKSN